MMPPSAFEAGALKSRDLTTRHHISSGHRETCFGVWVDADYKTSLRLLQGVLWAAHRIKVFTSISFCFSYSYVRQTKLASSLVNVWAHYKIVIDWSIDESIDRLIDWLINSSIHNWQTQHTLHRTAHVRTAPVRSQHVAPRGTFRYSRPRLLPRMPLPIPTPLKLLLLARASACPRLRSRCCCCCRRPAAVGTPYRVWAPT